MEKNSSKYKLGITFQSSENRRISYKHLNKGDWAPTICRSMVFRALSPSAVMRTMALTLGSLTRMSTMRRPIPTPTTVPAFFISRKQEKHFCVKDTVSMKDLRISICYGDWNHDLASEMSPIKCICKMLQAENDRLRRLLVGLFGLGNFITSTFQKVSKNVEKEMAYMSLCLRSNTSPIIYR